MGHLQPGQGDQLSQSFIQAVPLSSRPIFPNPSLHHNDLIPEQAVGAFQERWKEQASKLAVFACSYLSGIYCMQFSQIFYDKRPITITILPVKLREVNFCPRLTQLINDKGALQTWGW